MVHSQRRRRGDARTWEQRLVQENKQWDSQVQHLAQAYLCHKHPSSAPLRVTPAGGFQVQAIHIFTRSTAEIPQHADELANVSLLHMGYLGCSPQRPSVAVSVEVLELYHRLRRRHPQLGLQAFTRTLCDLHNVRLLCITYRVRPNPPPGHVLLLLSPSILNCLRRLPLDTALYRIQCQYRAQT